MSKLIVFILLTATTANAKTVLSWESNNPNNREWTEWTLATINNNFESLNKAQDIKKFCPKYEQLNRAEQINVWGELISQLAFHESGWKPTRQLTEMYLGVDYITGKTVVSEGLLQLSYCDIRWAKWCQFDWEKDKHNNGETLTTIQDPKNNLQCGIGILARQTEKYGAIVIEKGAYWSTLKVGHHSNKTERIAKQIQSMIPQCK